MGIVKGIANPVQSLSEALVCSDVLELRFRLAFNWNVIGEAPLIMNHIQLSLPPPWTQGCSVFHSLTLNLSLPVSLPPYAPSASFSHMENVSHVQWSDAKEQGPLLGPQDVGQCASGAHATRNRKKRGGGTKERRKAIKRSRGGGEMRWRAKVESFIMACALYCAISSSI